VQVTEVPFSIEQVKGATLGYRIVPFDPEGIHGEEGPTLIAFPIPMEGTDKVVGLASLDSAGHPLVGSDRQIRVVKPGPIGILPIALSALPLVLMSAILLRRTRRYRG
jgi:hypothetical protein